MIMKEMSKMHEEDALDDNFDGYGDI